MENFDDEFGDLSGYKILSFEEATQGFEVNKNPFAGVSANWSFEEISFDRKFGKAGGDNKCVATKGDFYSENMDFNKLWNDLSNRTNEKFFFYYQNYALSNPSTIGGISPTVLTSTSTTYTPSKYFEYTKGTEKKSALLTVELNERACFISLKNSGSVFYLNPEKKEMEFRLEFVYTDYLDKRDFNDATGKYELEKEYNAVIIKTYDADGYVALSKKLGLRNDAKNQILSLFTEKIKETKDDPAALKFLYEKMPDFVIDNLLSKLDGKFNNEIIIAKDKKTGKSTVISAAQKFVWEHLEKLVNYDDQGAFSWTKDSSGALLNLLKVFKNSQFLFESFKGNQTMVNRIFENMNKTSVVDGMELSNKTLFANFITALCIDNAFEGLRILDKEFTIGNGYAISSGTIFQEEKDNEFFLQQMEKKAERKITFEYGIRRDSVRTSLETIGEGNLYHPMDIVRIKFTDVKSEEQPFPFVSAMTIKAFAEERDQQLREDAIRIGFDVLAIVLGVVFFPAGGAVGIAAESIGIGLALADIGITANREDIEQSPGGKEFLQTWNKVYLVGGLTFAGIALIEQVFAKSVFCYLEALKSGSPLLKEYEKSLGKILLQREILTFAGNTLKPNTEINLKILAYNSDKIPKATAFAFGRYENLLPLYKAGAVVVEIGEKEYALVYKGERILQGFYNEKWTRSFYRELKKSFRIPEQLEAKLENFYKLIPKKNGNVWQWINQLGKEVRTSYQTEKQILDRIEQNLKDIVTGKINKVGDIFEVEVGEEWFRIAQKNNDRIVDYRNEVNGINSKGKFGEKFGDIDFGTQKYIAEVKSNLTEKQSLKDLEKQLRKYIPEYSNSEEKYFNAWNRKVVVICDKLDETNIIVKDLKKKDVIFLKKSEITKLYN
ncbi:hypothetical protein [Chryseobacterium binzhouense]|uniref:hypothetical protein n=1 Tax=Chryseobacterium binzhouense TaxID=2593646 RepID=UPI00289C9D5D|nr:hypothetical protein [Chryseobacterium binzhouense]